ncbi:MULTISPECIES: helix-turn-helix domain-containing protein [Bacillus]|uniref:helix-turn-helix domain-containing protein n=1 Tax=Bacillus TaxID=1386 RepID=UPI000C783B32|nr:MULTISPECIES: helix-turn-helix transcriptional regulator [Bacillus]MCP1161235.1 helix-turn-helix domain-containing protein [Bacillus infantis]PLR70558.1 hypothetical protein CYJ37_23800 [Bacillus sp. UMB0728]
MNIVSKESFQMLREARKSKHLLLIEVGKACGLNPTTVARLESGTNSNPEHFQKVSRFLNVNPITSL